MTHMLLLMSEMEALQAQQTTNQQGTGKDAPLIWNSFGCRVRETHAGQLVKMAMCFQIAMNYRGRNAVSGP